MYTVMRLTTDYTWLLGADGYEPGGGGARGAPCVLLPMQPRPGIGFSVRSTATGRVVHDLLRKKTY